MHTIEVGADSQSIVIKKKTILKNISAGSRHTFSIGFEILVVLSSESLESGLDAKEWGCKMLALGMLRCHGNLLINKKKIKMMADRSM